MVSPMPVNCPDPFSMPLVTLTLPWPPSANHYWRFTRGGQKYLTAKAKQFRADVQQIVFNNQADHKIAGDIGLYIDAHFPDKRRRDLDNTLKCTLDALQHAGVFCDDSQVTEIHIVRRHKIPGGEIRITIHGGR